MYTTGWKQSNLNKNNPIRTKTIQFEHFVSGVSAASLVLNYVVVVCKQLPISVVVQFQGVGLRPLACWDCGFESRRRHGYTFLVGVACFQVEVSANGRSLVQRSPKECGVSECNLEASAIRRLMPARAVDV